MLRPMVDPAQPTDPTLPADLVEPASEPPEPSEPPGAAEPPPIYILPTARKVVSSGLQLALASTSDLRRASIYIGLLVLGAFGPAIVGLLLIVGRLGDEAGDTFGALFGTGGIARPPDPALEAALLIVVLEALVGVLLFIAISIDAQVMGIAILGGRAGDRPLRLWEALVRARQTFWRMLGAGTVVGIASAFIQLLIVGALGGLSRSQDAASVVAAIIATVLVAPLAYVTTSIVLGDVAAMEALSRSWRLFRVRRMLAVVVVLFTLVTSAIQLFALSAGLDLVARAADILHVSLTSGALPFATALLLVLAAVVAYGSLTFTIGAVVAAPQVTGFLGLTYFSGGLDRARSEAARPPRGFRYVTRPMLIAIAALAGVVALQIPAINSIEPTKATPIGAFLRDEAGMHEFVVSPIGYLEPASDPAGDRGAGPPASDIILADYGFVPFVPEWLVDETFSCKNSDVACGATPLTSTFDDGAYLFVLRTAGDGADVEACAPCEFGPTLALLGEARASAGAGPYPGASIAFTATFDGGRGETDIRRWNGSEFYFDGTRSLARWDGTDRVFLIPADEVASDPVAWNMQTSTTSDGAGADDRLGSADMLMLPWQQAPELWLDPASNFAP
jgi:hypothetical protein